MPHLPDIEFSYAEIKVLGVLGEVNERFTLFHPIPK